MLRFSGRSKNVTAKYKPKPGCIVIKLDKGRKDGAMALAVTPRCITCLPTCEKFCHMSPFLRLISLCWIFLSLKYFYPKHLINFKYY